ncbi:MAG: GH3 auxin-responsive promoter family protein [Bacteroidales bacterium]
MPLINSLVSWFITKRNYQIDFFKRYPVEVQNDILEKLIREARDTAFGRDHQFGSIQSYRDFCDRVPIREYPAIRPYIERAFNGESDVLWPGDVKWFAKSSGTTSEKSKFIPVTPNYMQDCHFQGGKDTLTLYFLNYPDSGLLLGKSLVVGGSHQISEYQPETYFGDLSAVMLQNLPAFAHWVRTPELSIALMDDWEKKIVRMAESTSKVNVTSLAGVPSWTLVLLRKVLEHTGKSDITEVWPNLEVFMHGGVSFTPYRDQYRQIIRNSRMRYMETYNASEGFFGIQDDPGSNDMLLMLDYDIFFEFIPLEDIGSEDPRVIGLQDVETGRNYALVISTAAGLWRYLIGDTIVFTSLDPPRIRISGRTRHFINAFGEELIIDNAESALLAACQATGAGITEYTAAPVFMNGDQEARHQWLIEFSREPEDLPQFVATLDDALKSVNSDYEAKRFKDIALKKPEIVAVRKGVFYDWLKEKGKLGGQHKVPRLSNDRILAEEILRLNHT